jgi:hypothetical protein
MIQKDLAGVEGGTNDKLCPSLGPLVRERTLEVDQPAYRLQELIFVLEVVVKRRIGHAQVFGQRSHADGIEPIGVDDFQRSFDCDVFVDQRRRRSSHGEASLPSMVLQ